MSVPFRVIATSFGLASAVAGAVVSPAIFPQAFAQEPQHKLVQTAEQLFPAPADLRRLKKFNVDIADSVSTKPERTQVISKIGFGERSMVSIVTTATGTYSSDAILSPYVRYPGIDVERKHWWYNCGCQNHFSMSTYTSPYGTWTTTRTNSGSFTYVTSQYAPAKRRR